jgi:TolB-like protein/tetratricopeptide (TPR) repeat protein
MKLFAELKRRNVIRMAGLYLVGAWLILQVAETLLPIFHTPDWVLQAMVVLLALGFVPAIVFSWLFELTPEGIKRDAEVTPDRSIARTTARRMDRLIFAGLLALIAVIAADRYWPRTPPAQADTQSSTAADPSNAPKAATVENAAAAPSFDPNSIAVLPFVNMSADKENEFFSDGISEELLNALVRVNGLQVASRTSSFAYKGKEMSSQAIARDLKVSHLLEGSVRKSGNRLRITAQLIDAVNDRHLWSETYDRDMTDIFAIQSEIATAIATALSTELGDGDKPVVRVRADTDNLPAYELYLKARELFITRRNLSESIRLYERVVEMDPNFARGWEGLAAVYSIVQGWGIRDRDYMAMVGASAKRALELDSTLSMPWAALSLTEMKNRPVNWEKSIDLANRAVEANPNNTTALLWRSVGWVYLGYFDKALADQRRCLELDPAYQNCLRWVSQSLVSEGKQDEAMAAFEQGVANGFIENRASAFIPILIRRGDLLSARLLLRNLGSPPELSEMIVQALQAPGGKHPEARAIIERLAADADSTFQSQIGNGLAYVWLGEFDLAGEFDDPLNDSVDPWMPGPPGWRNSAGFKHKLETWGVVDYWRKHGFPPQCQAVGETDFSCDEVQP